MINIASMIFRGLPIFPQRSPNIIEQCYVRRTIEFSSNYTTNADADTAGTLHIKKLLKDKFPLARSIKVFDVSGGCGEMYDIFVESVEFKGLSVVKQHRLINETLRKEIKNMHGLTIETAIPPGTS